MTSPPSPADWTIEPLSPSAPGSFSNADLDPFAPLWCSLMDRHREVWHELPLRSHEESWARRRAQYRDWLGRPGSFALVARRGDRPVGYTVVAVEEGDETYATGERRADIHTLVVLPEERGRGIGAALMAELERRLLAAGITDVFVGTMHGNDAAQRFYERRGYRPFVRLNHRRLTGA